MTTQLEIYQQALLALGEVPVASLSENREARRLCDFVWNAGFVNQCLEEGLWKFAIRAVKLTYDTGPQPAYGFTRAFTLPDDFIRTVKLSTDENETIPITANGYTEEAGFIYASIDDIYLRYVSNDASYGGNLTAWPESFSVWTQLNMATQVGPKLTSSTTKLDALKKDAKKALSNARSKSAMEGGTAFPPMGTWVSARSGRWGGRSDRGSRGNLIG